MASLTNPCVSLAYTAYQAYQSFRNGNLEPKRDDTGKRLRDPEGMYDYIPVPKSTCDTVGRMILSGFVYALLEVVAIVETVVKAPFAALVAIITYTAILFGHQWDQGGFFINYLVTPFLNGMEASSACISLLYAQYVNATEWAVPCAVCLHNTVYPCREYQHP